MDLESLKKDLQTNKIDYLENEPLAKYTTWKIGGPADILINLTNPEILRTIILLANKLQIPFTFLGGGSNVLISDTGIRGIVIRNSFTGIEIASPDGKTLNSGVLAQEDSINQTTARLIQLETGEYYDFSKLDYDESSYPRIKVVINSGTILAYAINYLISQGITGLQWYAGIPGTVGGAVFNNIHGGSHFFEEYLEAVEVIDEEGQIKIINRSDIVTGYDHSSLQESHGFITRIFLNLPKGDPQKAQKTAMVWAQEKRKKQPYNSAGCCFKNISETDRTRLNLASNSWGYIIDKILDLKGYTVGGASISDLHGAFIVNNANAKASDVIAILNRVYEDSALKLDQLTPKTEIFFLGFSESEISKYK